MMGTVSRPSGLQVRKWRGQARAQDDLAQTVFYQTPEKQVDIKGNPNRFATVTEKGIDPFKKTTCPFCLGLNQLSAFLISTKKGFDRGRGKCPLCGQGMKLQTLVKMEKWSAVEYAAWAFEYRSSGFWQKIQPFFATWKKRLGMMGWTEAFWSEYKRLRGDEPEKPTEAEDAQYLDYEESEMMKV
jgi:hypothetical protein